MKNLLFLLPRLMQFCFVCYLCILMQICKGIFLRFFQALAKHCNNCMKCSRHATATSLFRVTFENLRMFQSRTFWWCYSDVWYVDQKMETFCVKCSFSAVMTIKLCFWLHIPRTRSPCSCAIPWLPVTEINRTSRVRDTVNPWEFFRKFYFSECCSDEWITHLHGTLMVNPSESAKEGSGEYYSIWLVSSCNRGPFLTSDSAETVHQTCFRTVPCTFMELQCDTRLSTLCN